MALRSLQKWHGAGNDFIVDVIEQGTAKWWTPERAREICNRNTGIGADGLLLAEVGSEVSMVLYNADGSIAEMSGNGIRCLVAAVHRATHATWSELKVSTQAGIKTVTLAMNGDAGTGSVDMGQVVLKDALPRTLGVANVGNPHIVVEDNDAWSDSERESLAGDLAAQVGGANVEFIRFIDQKHMSLRVIERGVGWTQACGTGTCASAAVAHSLAKCDADVVISNPGGDLRVQLNGSNAVLSGPVQFIGNVEWLEA
jgi:diaminopimelate epimerase